MKLFGLLIVVSLVGSGATFAQSAQETKTVRVYVQGDSSRPADFVAECKHEFANHKLSLQLVPFDGEFQYNVIVAQESSLGGAAAAAVALDKKGLFVASVVRSGRMSGKGALNASARSSPGNWQFLLLNNATRKARLRAVVCSYPINASGQDCCVILRSRVVSRKLGALAFKILASKAKHLAA